MSSVHSQRFLIDFLKLHEIVKHTKATRDNSLSVRKHYAKGVNYHIANISPSVQALLGSQTNAVYLSDDTVIKMLAHHPEMADDLLQIFQNLQYILNNAIKVVKESDVNVIYFSIYNKNYIATVKATQDKKELYLTTVYAVDEKRFNKRLEKYKDH